MGRIPHSDMAAVLAATRRRVRQLEEDQGAVAGHDPVTGLVDLREFCLRLEIELSRARRHERPLALALLDLEGFTELNASEGRAAGDVALCAVAGVLNRFLRAYDLACRTTGDEFALLLPETDTDGAYACLERILLELQMLSLGATTGVAAFTGQESAMQLFGGAGRVLDDARAQRPAPSPPAGEESRAEPEAA